MTMYFIDPNGAKELSPYHFTRVDKTIAEGEPSFKTRVGLTFDCMRKTFIGEGNEYYDYLLHGKAPYFFVTHPQVTFSCQDKIDMYNETGCTLDGNVGRPGDHWKLEHTIKAIFFWNKNDHPEHPEHNYHIAVIPGQPTGTHIDVAKSFKDVWPSQPDKSQLQAAWSPGKRVRLFPAHEQLGFGIMQEGCFSPLPPDNCTQIDASGRPAYFQSRRVIDAIYYDENYVTDDRIRNIDGIDLRKNYPASPNLNDLSIAMTTIPCAKGEYIEKGLQLKKAQALAQFIDGKCVPLEIVEECGRKVAYVTHPLIGYYRDLQEGGSDVTLRFSYIPNHMLSLVMSHEHLWHLSDSQFYGKVHRVNMTYIHPKAKAD